MLLTAFFSLCSAIVGAVAANFLNRYHKKIERKNELIKTINLNLAIFEDEISRYLKLVFDNQNNYKKLEKNDIIRSSKFYETLVLTNLAFPDKDQFSKEVRSFESRFLKIRAKVCKSVRENELNMPQLFLETKEIKNEVRRFCKDINSYIK